MSLSLEDKLALAAEPWSGLSREVPSTSIRAITMADINYFIGHGDKWWEEYEKSRKEEE